MALSVVSKRLMSSTSLTFKSPAGLFQQQTALQEVVLGLRIGLLRAEQGALAVQYIQHGAGTYLQTHLRGVIRLCADSSEECSASTWLMPATMVW